MKKNEVSKLKNDHPFYISFELYFNEKFIIHEVLNGIHEVYALFTCQQKICPLLSGSFTPKL